MGPLSIPVKSERHWCIPYKITKEMRAKTVLCDLQMNKNRVLEDRIMEESNKVVHRHIPYKLPKKLEFNSILWMHSGRNPISSNGESN